MDHQQALQLLRTALNNPQAEFRDGQWRAIDGLVNQNRKLLVVQRTGWGKSSVYFISTRITSLTSAKKSGKKYSVTLVQVSVS